MPGCGLVAGLKLSPVNFIVNKYLRNLIGTDFLKHTIHLLAQVTEPVIGGIHNVKQNLRILDLFKR